MMKKLLIPLLLLALLCGCVLEVSPPTAPPAATAADSGSLTVHFIDVGQADCALLECGGEAMLIDGGNVDDGDLVVSYLERQGIDSLDIVVSTHPHEDHVGGLGAVLAVFPTARVLSPTTTYSSGCFDDFLYYADQQGLTVEIPQPGDTFSLGQAEVAVLGPVMSYAETNDTSIVLRVALGEDSFLFTGDMETAAENDMLDYWGSRIDWNVDVLKVGHHGSNTSTGYRFLYEAAPDYAVISVGTGNTYGHPHDEPMSRLHDAGCTIFRTDELGTILAVTDGKGITLTWEKQTADPENAEPAEKVYIGNRNSKKFHLPTCGGLPAEKNRVFFESLEDATAAGYTPCGTCLGG